MDGGTAGTRVEAGRAHAELDVARAENEMRLGTERLGDGDLESCRAFFPFQIRDVSNAFAEIQNELRSQYAVSYKPADFKSDGHYRAIEIVANDRKNLFVRARRGYYAPAAQ